jgi:hypothetical protein
MDQRRTGSGMPTIWTRAMAERVDGLLREAEPAAAPRTDKSQTEAVRRTQPGWTNAEARTLTHRRSF